MCTFYLFNAIKQSIIYFKDRYMIWYDICLALGVLAQRTPGAEFIQKCYLTAGLGVFRAWGYSSIHCFQNIIFVMIRIDKKTKCDVYECYKLYIRVNIKGCLPLVGCTWSSKLLREFLDVKWSEKSELKETCYSIRLFCRPIFSEIFR